MTLYHGGEVIFQCHTLELPWKNNRNRVSCIPTGRYTLKHRSGEESGKYNYPHFIVKGVDGRSYILIHSGNLYTHTLGCILVGKRFVDINDDGHPDITHSRQTLRQLRGLSVQEMPLIVQNAADLAGSTGPVPAAEPETLQVTDKDLDGFEELKLAA